MALDGYERSRHSRDPAHDDHHLDGVGYDVYTFKQIYKDRNDQFDWNALVAALGYHDTAVASFPPSPLSLLAAQNWEHRFAALPAKRYMRRHGFPAEESKRIEHLVRIHPLAPQDPRRVVLERHTDERLKRTGRLFYAIDSMEVFRQQPKARIDAMLEHISNSFWGIAPVPFYTMLKKYFERNIRFELEMPDFPWLSEELQRRSQLTLAYVKNLEKSKRDVRKKK